MEPHPANKVRTALKAATSRLTYDRQWAILISALLLVDALVVYASLSLAYTVRLTSGLLAYASPYDPGAYGRFVQFSIPVWLGFFALLGLYRRDRLLGGVAEYQGVMRACTDGVLAIIVMSFFWRDVVPLSRGWLLIAWGLSVLFVGVERFTLRRLAQSLRRRGWLTARALIVGANDQGSAIAQQWRYAPASGIQVVGFVDDFKPIGTPVTDDLRVLGRPSALDEIMRQTGAQEAVVIAGAVAWESFEEIIGHAAARNGHNGYTVRLSPGFYEMLSSGVVVTTKSFVPLLTVDPARLVGIERLLKWLVDYLLGGLAAIFALPAAAVMALGLRLAHRRGPWFDRHPTIGQGGQAFPMLKIHTVKAPSAGGPRVTWLDRALLRTGFDKLPQFLNLLAGQMSLVGPRPRVAGQESADPRVLHNLHTVKPGIVGPWSTEFSRLASDEMQGELYYIRNWTVWLDLQILAQILWSLAASALRPQARRPKRGDQLED